MNFRLSLAKFIFSFVLATLAVLPLPCGAIAQEPQSNLDAVEDLTAAETGSVNPDASEILDPAAAESVPTADSSAGPEVILKEFQSHATPEQFEAGMTALAEFESSAAEFGQKIVKMRRQHTQLVNRLSEDKQLYRTLRNEARDQMNQTYRKSLRLIEFMPHPYAMRFITTVLEQRYKNDIYDKETLEGAAKLLDYQIHIRYIVLLAARTGMVQGDFDLANSIYKNVQEDELEDRDKRLIGRSLEIEKQFAAEQKLLENDPDDLPKVRILTTRGEFTVELYIHSAPSTVSHFIRLAESGFYDGLDFFQVIDGLLALTGDPLGDGSSAPDQKLADEHDREGARMPLYGSLVMAKLPIPDTRIFVPNSAGTQFAILFLPLPSVAEQQTVFGRVIDGFDVLGSLRRVDPSKKKKKNAIVAPPDRIIECEVLNRPDELPEVIYAVPSGPLLAPPAPAASQRADGN